MKVYQPNEIRNITLVGNAGSGKTTLAEAFLFEGGIIARRGDIDSKNTVSDYRDMEHEIKSSVFSTVLYSEYNGTKINFIDTPGSDNFISGAISGLAVTESAVLLLNAKNGIEVGTEIIWRHCQATKKPTILVVNHLDNDNANFEKTIESAKRLFGKKVTIIQYPVATGANFSSVVDVLKMKLYRFLPDGKVEVEDIPSAEKNKAQELRSSLMEAAAEGDEELMEHFFENGELSLEDMYKGIKEGIHDQTLLPVLCIAAKKDLGIKPLLDFICSEAPSPLEAPIPKTTEGKEIPYNPKSVASAFIFKTTIESHIGEVNYFKVISGIFSEGLDVVNIQKQSKERLTQLFSTAGKIRNKVTQLVAGDIGATVKLKDTKTGHTIGVKEADWKFPDIEYPNPKHRIAIKAVSESDDEKLGEILHHMHDEDPTLLLEYSKELKQLILLGQGEAHLNMVKWHFDNIYKIPIQFISPRIPYRETITKSSHADYRHKKQSGGAGQFGEVHLIVEPYTEGKPEPSNFKFADKQINLSVKAKEEYPLKWGGKLVYCNCIVGGVIDARFMPAILKGIMEKMEEGPLTGSYARDIRVYVYDGKMHPVDSNEISFKLAGAKAFSTAFKQASPKIMEPVYDVEVVVPSERMGDVMSDLQGRRAVIMGMVSDSGYEKISTRVPLAELNNYSTSLRALTNGRATYSMKFSEYTQVPSDVQDKLLKAYEEEYQEE